MSPCFCLEILENTALSLVFVFKKKRLFINSGNWERHRRTHWRGSSLGPSASDTGHLVMVDVSLSPCFSFAPLFLVSGKMVPTAQARMLPFGNPGRQDNQSQIAKWKYSREESSLLRHKSCAYIEQIMRCAGFFPFLRKVKVQVIQRPFGEYTYYKDSNRYEKHFWKKARAWSTQEIFICFAFVLKLWQQCGFDFKRYLNI